MSAPATAVPAADLGEAHESCPVCEGTSFTPVGLQLQESPAVELLECKTCSAVFASRFPSEQFLTSLYDPEIYEPDLNSSPNASIRLGKRIADAIMELLPNATAGVRVLDFGGADGTLLRQVEAHLPASVDRSKSSFVVADLFPQELDAPLGYTTADDLFASDDTYDVILASAVVEHLPNVREVLLQLDARLASGGLFYGRTPYELPLAKLYKGYPSRWPRHLFDMGPEFWGAFGSEVLPGYSIKQSQTSPPDSDFSADPARTVVATALKAVHQIEAATTQRVLGYDSPKWRFVGSWEAWFMKP